MAGFVFQPQATQILRGKLNSGAPSAEFAMHLPQKNGTIRIIDSYSK
jgi:hypothetical protein